MPQGGAGGQNVRHLGLFLLIFFLYRIIQFEQQAPFRVFVSVISDDRVQCPRLGLEVKIYISAGGIRASQSTFF